MNKNTKMILGVGAVAIVGYLVYKQMNKKAGFANATGMTTLRNAQPRGECVRAKSGDVAAQIGGRDVYECCATGVYAYHPGPNIGCTNTTVDPKSTIGGQFL